MTDLLAEVVLHTFIAAIAVESLLRWWRVTEPGFKLRMRLGILLVPLALHPLLRVLAPFRDGEGFEAEWAVLQVRTFARVELWGLRADQTWLALCAAVGGVLLAADLLPWARRRGLGGAGWGLSPSVAPLELQAQVALLAQKLSLAPTPSVLFYETSAPLLSCRGVRHPALVVSRGTLDLLDAQELEAGLAHELAHAQRGDVLASWGLFAARLLQAFNPVVHVTARAMARDLERRADVVAQQVTGRPLALASGLLKVHAATAGRGGDGSPLQRLVRRARAQELEDRCRRLLALRALRREGDAKSAVPPVSFAGLRLASTAIGLVALLFFVT